MIGRIIAWVLELFREVSKEQREIEKNIETLEKEIEEIEDAKISADDINDHFNK